MSKTATAKPTARHGHGTTDSYIIGFILSLEFTLIPYFLVVNKVITGTTLLALIIGIALLQMAIQLLFFLHLGRGPKPLYNIVFFGITAGGITMAVVASLFIMHNLYKNMSPDAVTQRLAQEENIAQIGGVDTGACNEVKDSHIVRIKDGNVNPARTEAKRCDSLTFINEDAQKRMIGFGSHPVHDGYGGVDDVVVNKGRPETITLNLAGNYDFHDHLDPTVTGEFSVAPY